MLPTHHRSCSTSALAFALAALVSTLSGPVAAAGKPAPAGKAGAAATARGAAKKPAQPPKLEMAPELRQRVEETLAQALASRDAVAQGTAMAALVDLGDAAAEQRVEDALAEENWGIKRYALLIAGREDRPSFYPAMAKVLENTGTRSHGFDLLEMLPAPVRVKVLQATIINPEDTLRQEVASRMVDQGDEEAVGVLDRLVTSSDTRLRDEGLALLPRLGSAAGVRYLTRLFAGKDATVRHAAQLALLQSKDPQVKPFLIETLRKATDARIKLEAAVALANRGVRDDVLPVLRGALEERDVELRVLAMNGIAALGDRVAAAELRPLAVNPREDPAITTAALHVLGGTGDIANLEVLREALSMDYPHLRVAAVEAMGDLRRLEAIPDLAAALSDGSVEVRAAAAVALGKVSGKDTVPPLATAVEREQDEAVRQKIIEALGRSGSQEGVLALQVLLVHPEGKVKQAAIDAMLEIGDPKSANTLLVNVEPREPEVMETAIRAICLLDPALGMVALRPNLVSVSLQLLHDLHAEAGPRGTVYLQAFLEEGTQAQRSVALDLLLRRGAEGLALVRQAARGNGDAAIRRAALRSLLVRGDLESLPVFVAGLGDADDALRGLCVEALGLLGGPAHQEALTAMLEDRAPSVRAASAHALIRLAQPRSAGGK